ncbi:3-hydroxybutyrate oligomer hydrolase family protein [Allohahella sp. A8]|uniref:3-hydroxybutyrate oligomer hydrolase family protein n=1 Tax=Allohahella sp. A8 TaxID=3141461 RepID=UPI003A7FA12F
MQKLVLFALAGATTLSVSVYAHSDRDRGFHKRPHFLQGQIHHNRYDGASNDLLTGGLGASGLASATPPAFVDPLNPTAEELRTLAIYNNYRALVDTAAGGGFGQFFGPQVDAGNDGRIPGHEFLAYLTTTGTGKTTAMVQIPDGFDPNDPCMVTAPSSGSRGIYGAIGTAGEWGLKKGCAVVYTDKGTGTGSHDLTGNTAQLIDGRLTTARGARMQFRADLHPRERRQFNAEYPNRFAFKHAHSRNNPEADWGQHVLQSIEFGFYVLNRAYRRSASFTPENTLVIASSVSNGGGASVRAAEQDTRGLIDGVAVSEPNVNPTVLEGMTIRQGEAAPISAHSRSLYDYTTALAVYQGCANLAPENASAPLNAVFNKTDVDTNICRSLSEKGLVAGSSLAEWASDAQRILNEEFALQPEQNALAPLHFGINVPQSIAVTYANSYGRFGVEDRTCELSMAAADSSGLPAPLSDLQQAALFSTSNGIPPTGGVNLIYDNASGGPTNLPLSISPSTGVQDYGLDALLCLRSLASGTNTASGTKLRGKPAAQARAVAKGIEAVRASGDLNGKPAIFVTGRADAVLPINHTSRPYFGLNRSIEGEASGLRYYEVLNAHHLDALNGFPGLNERYVPLHYYYFQALDLMYAHLKTQKALPPSQVIRTTPRGAGAPALSQENLPEIAIQPAELDRIVFSDNQVQIPE